MIGLERSLHSLNSNISYKSTQLHKVHNVVILEFLHLTVLEV